MAAPATDKDDGIHLDILGQQILPIYTQICFIFSVADSSSYPQLIETLEAGLGRLHTAFPWLAGRVVDEGSSTSNTGLFKIRSIGAPPGLVVKDIREDTSPSMESLRQANSQSMSSMRTSSHRGKQRLM